MLYSLFYILTCKHYHITRPRSISFFNSCNHLIFFSSFHHLNPKRPRLFCHLELEQPTFFPPLHPNLLTQYGGWLIRFADGSALPIIAQAFRKCTEYHLGRLGGLDILDHLGGFGQFGPFGYFRPFYFLGSLETVGGFDHLGGLGHQDRLGHLSLGNLGGLSHLGHLGRLVGLDILNHLGVLGSLDHFGILGCLDRLDHLGGLGSSDHLGHLAVQAVWTVWAIWAVWEVLTIQAD